MRKLIGICVEQVSPSERDAEEQRRRTLLSALARESGWNSIEQTRSKTNELRPTKRQMETNERICEGALGES